MDAWPCVLLEHVFDRQQRPKIKAGKITGKLPSREKLAEQYGFTRMTVARAWHPE
jgi:DNA-binding GntR family transcriptional regulator